jgi:hypothetical protein
MNSLYNQVTPPTSFTVGYCQDLREELGVDYHASLIREELRCRYPSKRCEMPRAIKRNGEMHRFCDAHRSKANLNQRRLEARRKAEMKEAERFRKPNGASPEIDNIVLWQPVPEPQPCMRPCDSSPPLHSVLAQDELDFLSELLSQNSLEDLHAESAGDEVGLTASSFPHDAGFSC